MSVLVMLLLAYLAGFTLIILAAHAVVQREVTAHGRDVLFWLGFAIAVLWPLAVLWYGFVALWFAIQWCLRITAEWSRCE